MDTVSLNKFRDNLENLLTQIVNRNEPLKVIRRTGEAFVVLSANDWQREQETRHVLQNQDLMQQIADSLKTHNRSQGDKPNEE